MERRRADIDEQSAAIQHVVTVASHLACAGSARAIAGEVSNALVPEPERAEDDVCVLVAMRHQPELPA